MPAISGGFSNFVMVTGCFFSGGKTTAPFAVASVTGARLVPAAGSTGAAGEAEGTGVAVAAARIGTGLGVVVWEKAVAAVIATMKTTRTNFFIFTATDYGICEPAVL